MFDIISTVFLAIIGAIIWGLKKNIEKGMKLEEQLQDDRIKIYNGNYSAPL